MQAQEFLRERMKELRRAERSWQATVREGKVLGLTPDEAEELVVSGEYTMLDVRPARERERAYVKPSQHVQIFQEDVLPDDANPRDKLKAAFTYATSTAFTGDTRMRVNEDFYDEVTAAVPKDQPVLVVCQSGQRSLCATDVLRVYGYKKIAWVKGGLNACKGGNFERGSLSVELGEDCEGLKFAGIAGLSKALGSTEVQRAEPGGNIKYYAKIAALFVGFDLVVYLSSLF
eukprot:PRCOL_00002596-RA